MNSVNEMPSNNFKPFFLITIDVEGDNLWSKHRKITTRNADFLPRFQSLCESFGLKPTYLTDYEMANSPAFQDLGRDVIKNKTGEIGMHLHAWNTPPIEPLTEDDYDYVPYLIDYPRDIIKEKITYLKKLLEDNFKVKIVSHRSGRWAFNETYAQILAEHGFKVDCSVTPHVSWKFYKGAPNGDGGTDYTHFPENCYFLDLNDISKPGNSSLLEVPLTIFSKEKPILDLYHKKVNQTFKNHSIARKVLIRLMPNVMWFRLGYYSNTAKDLLNMINQSLIEKRTYVEFMMHSFDLMPGINPSYPKERHINDLYKDLKLLFNEVSKYFRSATLAEFYDHMKRQKD